MKGKGVRCERGKWGEKERYGEGGGGRGEELESPQRSSRMLTQMLTQMLTRSLT